MMSHVLVIGGGVIGLSLAYELACREHAVTLVEREKTGRKSSWAGAGILPPAKLETAIHSIEKLEALSNDLHLEWSKRLASETGIENELTRSGGLYLARTPGERAALRGLELYWGERKIEFQRFASEEVARRFPSLNSKRIVKALFVPEEYQLRNPRHLRALNLACQRRGVQIIEDAGQVKVRGLGNKSVLHSLEVNGIRLQADFYCIAAGAWSQQLLEELELPMLTTPVRGQIALFDLKTPVFEPIINEGTRYLVPRRDGHVIAGATIEEVGFNEFTEPEAIADLVQWANSLIPQCNANTLAKAWAGLRPGSYDGLPYLGFLAEGSNLLVATGHFKSGLQLSTATAVLIADLIQGITPSIDLAPFSPSRAELARISPP
jgi:glycine oxidase